MFSLSRLALALFFIVAGVAHFITPAPYLAIMPPYIPWPAEMVAVSGGAAFVGARAGNASAGAAYVYAVKLANGELCAAAARSARQEIAVRDDVVSVRKQIFGDALPIHGHDTFFRHAARRDTVAATSASVLSIGTSSGDSKPMARQMSSPSAHWP